MDTIPLDKICTHLADWKTAATKELDELKLFVGVDIGGTNTRVVLGNLLTSEKLTLDTFKASTIRTLIEGLCAVSEAVGAIESSGACLAVAGRVVESGTAVIITNYDPGSDSAAANDDAARGPCISLDDLPRRLFPRDATVFVNDLEGSCHGIAALGSVGTFHTRFGSLLCAEPRPELDYGGHYVVMAMGTGLGVGFLFSRATALRPGASQARGSPRTFNVVATEGGHMLAVRPARGSRHAEADDALVEFVSRELYAERGVTMEWEDVCSGRGLELTYRWARERCGGGPERLSAGEIARAAMDGSEEDAASDPAVASARLAMRMHYRFLFRCAQQLAVVTQCKGVVLAGDNQFQNDKFVREIAEELREEFLDHPHREWLENIRVYVPRGIMNMNIHGALHVAHQFATVGHL